MLVSTKPWYLSRTVWAALVTIATGIAGAAGLPVSEFDGALLTEAVLEGLTALAGLAALIGRLTATTRIR